MINNNELNGDFSSGLYGLDTSHPFFTKTYLSSKTKEARMNFAHQYINFDWQSVMFGDEMSIRLGKYKILIWGSISNVNGAILDLQFLKQPTRSQGYIQDILTPIVKPYFEEHNGLTFAHDMASWHQASRVKCWFRRHEINFINLPPNSSDFNLMANLWMSLRLKLEEMTGIEPTSYQQAVDIINEAWSDVKGDYSDNFKEQLYATMKNRLRRCITNNGKILYK